MANYGTPMRRRHDAMVRFLIELCKDSDALWNCQRDPHCERRYQRARRLIKQAGTTYKPPKLRLKHDRTPHPKENHDG